MDAGASISYAVESGNILPQIAIRVEGRDAPACAWRTVAEDPEQHGSWATRGETASDAEDREVFIDASGRLVFGHSTAGSLNAAYCLQAELAKHIHPRGKTMQPTTTFFRSGRKRGAEGFFGFWQIRMGADQPKRFSIVFDRDLGGRLHHVCDRYYADAVDSQVDLSAGPGSYDPYLALERMPLRLFCPESLVPNYGWHMEEYFPGYAKAAYPYGEDSGVQTAAFLAFEGHATRRDWEMHFGDHVMSQLPLWGAQDGEGFFVRRPGGWTRWAYNTDYVTKFPLMEGGNWTDSEHLYHTAVLFQDAELKSKALELMKHDVNVKLDLKAMTFPPCWNPLTGKLQDHRDDWQTTSGLAYCAEISSQILYPETKDPRYLEVADSITSWLGDFLASERRMNRFHAGVNTYHCFMGPLVRSLVHRYERGGDRDYLHYAQDLAWVMILTLGVTADHDAAGRAFTGVTCVGVRGCVDYDCAPNLCHEKDLAFLDIAAALLPHVNGSGYAKLLAMQRMALPRDSWKDAFHIQEQRDLNLRTNYDNYARGMANLAFALNRSSNPLIAAYERLVPARGMDIQTRRETALANGCATDQEANIQIRFLLPGRYLVEIDHERPFRRTAAELERGFTVKVAANTLRKVKVTSERLDAAPEPAAPPAERGITWLSDLPVYAAQRGIGLPTPIFRQDRSFAGRPIQLGGRAFDKGLGLAANTVLVYALNGRFTRFQSSFGVDPDAPSGSIYLTVFVDGKCRFTSGGTKGDTPIHEIDIDVTHGKMLVLRTSGNWDNNGNIQNDFGNLGAARLLN